MIKELPRVIDELKSRSGRSPRCRRQRDNSRQNNGGYVKRSMASVIFLVCSRLICADVTAVDIAGGSVSLLKGEMANISLENEIVAISLEGKKYRVAAAFTLANKGEAATLDIGFPNWYGYLSSSETSGPLEDFSLSVNGKSLDCRYTKVDPKIGYSENNVMGFSGWYTSRVTFAKNARTVVTVSYTCALGSHGPYNSIDYLYGTGKTWRGPIGSMIFSITLDADTKLLSIERGTPIDKTIVKDWKKTGEHAYEVSFGNIEPGSVYEMFRVVVVRHNPWNEDSWKSVK
jgi:hypothetical protein